MKHTILFDADVLAYRVGFAVEQKVITEEEVAGETWQIKTYEVEPLENALQILKDTVEFILFELGSNDYEMYFTGKSNFRKELATVKEYKGNRKHSRHPLHLADIRKYLISQHGAKLTDGQEADDDLGIRLTELGDCGIIATIDKDLLMVPGKHYNWVNNTKLITTPEQGLQYFYTQLLVGDSTDNIPGCPGIGGKRAEKALHGLTDEKSLWQAVYDLYDTQMSKFAHKILDDMKYEDGKVYYKHWNTGVEMAVPLQDYIEEIGNLLWIRRLPGQVWKPPV